MSIASEVARLRREIMQSIENRLFTLFGYTLTATSSPLGDGDQVQSSDDSAPGEGGPRQRPVQRIEQWGFRSRQPGKLRGLWIRIGSSNVAFIGVAPSNAYGPDDLEEGESAQFCSAGGTEIRLDKDGNVTINAASGKDVTVNGGTAKVGRVGDQVDNGTWTHVPASGAGVSACSLTYTPPGGTPTVISTNTAVTGKINAGADHFKG